MPLPRMLRRRNRPRHRSQIAAPQNTITVQTSALRGERHEEPEREIDEQAHRLEDDRERENAFASIGSAWALPKLDS